MQWAIGAHEKWSHVNMQNKLLLIVCNIHVIADTYTYLKYLILRPKLNTIYDIL